METSNKHHANRPSALTAADRARIARTVAGKPDPTNIIAAVAFKLAAVAIVCGLVAGCM